MSPKLKKIYPVTKQIEKGKVYVKYSCGCVFLDTDDKKRKKRSVFEKIEGKRTNRTFCPNHKSNSKIEHRFKICPMCHKKIIVARLTKDGYCFRCNKAINAKKAKEKIKEKKKKNCFQYNGKMYELRKNEKIENKPLCGNRSFCLSFIKSASDLLQCKDCSHFFNEFTKD